MTSRSRATACGLLLLALAPGGTGAQERLPPVQLSVLPTDGSLRITINDLLDDDLAEALQSGLPLRISIVTELWSDGFFDSQRGRVEWRSTVAYDPLDGSYSMNTTPGPPVGQTLGSIEDAREALRQSIDVPLGPGIPGRYYYLVTVVVETLALSDLQELQRWLRGELGPAVEGDRNMGSAVGSGVRRLFVRMLGLQARRLSLDTPTFQYPPAPGELPPVPGGPF